MPGTPSLTTKTKTDVKFILNDGPHVYKKPITLGTDATAGLSSDGIISKGAVMALKAADSKHYEYANGGSGGLGTAVGFVDREVDVSAGDATAVMIVAFAVIDTSECDGYHADVATDLASNHILFV